MYLYCIFIYIQYINVEKNLSQTLGDKRRRYRRKKMLLTRVSVGMKERNAIALNISPASINNWRYSYGVNMPRSSGNLKEARAIEEGESSAAADVSLGRSTPTKQIRIQRDSLVGG